MNKGEITYTIKIKKRTGLFWNKVNNPACHLYEKETE